VQPLQPSSWYATNGEIKENLFTSMQDNSDKGAKKKIPMTLRADMQQSQRDLKIPLEEKVSKRLGDLVEFLANSNSTSNSELWDLPRAMS
jgi:hypothetical protein